MSGLQRTQDEVLRAWHACDAERAALEREVAELRAQCEHQVRERAAAASRSLAELRSEWERRIAEERTEWERKFAALGATCDRHIREEREASEARVVESRRQADALLEEERLSAERLRKSLRDLPPLQAAMESGDLGALEAELQGKAGAPESLGEAGAAVGAVVRLAHERLLAWRSVERIVREVVRQVERLPGSAKAMMEQCQRLFRALKEAQLTKMDLRRSSPEAIDRIAEVLCAWLDRAMAHPNDVQRLIVHRVVAERHLGPFDFADLDICLRLVDRPASGNEIFFARARAIVSDDSAIPKDFRALLSHLETMLFFLKYTKAEDLGMAHSEFRKQRGRLHQDVARYLARAELEYPPGAELVRIADAQGGSLEGAGVEAVLEEILRPSGGRADKLGVFREIFYQWAVVMKRRFDLLVLPHHTQVICLLVFRSFLESKRAAADHAHALIAQVGTGEGKSMIIAALALYVVIVLRKKAHIVIDDETLLERDFCTFRPLFDSLRAPDDRPISSRLCVTEEKLAACDRDDPRVAHMIARVDPDVDICYCEAKHVQSFYASLARSCSGDFDEGYEGRVLILDEVDALIIDEEPNEAFVYENEELGEIATTVAGILARGLPTVHVHASLADSPHPGAERVAREMCQEWARAQVLRASDDYVYVRGVGRYCALQGGRANPNTWSLALECKNFQDGLSRRIVFQERLFVMSRPRVFRKYHRILGLTGSIGSSAERSFLQQTYAAAFFEVPPFLKTCRGSPFHEAVPVALGSARRAVHVEPTVEEQLARLADVAFEARERVPVLIIARDRAQSDAIVERLRLAARSRGLGDASDDIVRSLSRALYEADPEQWKDNLNRSTLPLGGAESCAKSWRVTVTDPRGGRGTDYRVDDPSVDAQGGLLVIPTAVPTSQREWTQFLGRTARQDRRGQFCAVLCEADYSALSAKFGEELSAPSSETSLECVDAIIAWGDREIASRIRSSAALYNCGVRVNELCEELFGRRQQMLQDPLVRERLVEMCQRLRWMSVREIDELAGRILDFDPTSVPTEAKDLGRPQEAPLASSSSAASTSAASSESSGPTPASSEAARATPRRGSDPALAMASLPRGAARGPPKVVVFCLDWSLSMLTRDTGTGLSRFGTCVRCVRRILRDQVRDEDFVGVVGFGATVETAVLPTVKKGNAASLDTTIAGLQAQRLGGTCFFDAVLECLQQLGQASSAAPPDAPRWLVCLTDGDDLGSRRDNTHGELVTRALEAKEAENLNVVMITVGRLKERNIEVIDGWVERVASAGGFAQHLSESNASAITSAFSVVAECLAAEVGGATEC